MKLNRLYKLSSKDIFHRYVKNLKQLHDSTVNESKITITIDDSGNNPKVGISQDAKLEFVEKAKELGEFNDQNWVNGLVKSMEQAGVQGFRKICEDEKPVTDKQIQQLIGLLVNLISK